MAKKQPPLLAELATLRDVDGLLWVDCRRAPEYRRGHIPGAIHLDTFPFSNERTTSAALPGLWAAWAEMFAAAGIGHGRTVVFYDQGMENRPGRPAFMLRSLGHEHVHVLNGGMAAWLEAGNTLSRDTAVLPPTAAGSFGPPAAPAVAAGVEEAVRALEAGLPFLDVRARAEFEARRRVQWNPRLGRIPGARHIEWTAFMERTREWDPRVGIPKFNPDLLRRFKPAETVEAMLHAAGIGKQDDFVVYCQKSHRACTVYLGLERSGFTRARVYIGSYREWSRRLELPVEKPARGAGAGAA